MQAWQVHENGEPSEVMRLEDVARPVARRRPGPAEGARREHQLPGRAAVPRPLPGPAAAALHAGRGDLRRDRGRPPRDRQPRAAARRFRRVRRRRRRRSAARARTSLDDAEAAALHIGYQTGWFGLHRRARLEAGETLLVHAAAGGVGSAAVQLGKAAGRAPSSVSSAAPRRRAVARELGCDVVIDRRSEDVVAAVKEATGGRGADVVYDPVGGEAYTQSAKFVAFEGRIVVVGFASGTIPSPGPQPRPGEELRDPRPALGPVQHQEPEAGPALPRAAHRAGRPGRDQAAGQRARAARRGRGRRAAGRATA